jgi:hypothetical protein
VVHQQEVSCGITASPEPLPDVPASMAAFSESALAASR